MVRTQNVRVGVVIVVVWLFIGLIATLQRGYFTGKTSADCARLGTIAVTIIAGPLNYVGVNPKVDKCDLPEPSK